MTLPEPKQGDVWLAKLDKLRPVVILIRDPLGHVRQSTKEQICTTIAVAIDCRG